MGVTSMIKFGGWMSIFGGVLLASAHIIDLTAGGIGTSLGKLLVFLAHLILVFSFFAIYCLQNNQNGVLGLIGMIFGILGTICVNAIVFVEIAATTGVAVELVFNNNPNHIIYSYGPLLFVFGMIFVGISIAKTTILPRWGGGMLILGTVIFAVGTMMGDASAVITTVGSVVTAGGFVRIGYSMAK